MSAKSGVVEMAMHPVDEAAPERALAKVDGPMLPMIERLAALPDFDVAKLEKLLDMQERILDRHAEAAFNGAFAEMQAQIPTIAERGRTNMGRYARLEDIIEVVRPILKAFGFSLSFSTQWPEKGTVRIVGILTHTQGHARQSEFLTTADTSGAKNAVQALGSAVSYGRRYTTMDLLSIVSRELDDDGRGTTKPAVPVPEGYVSWALDLESTAGEKDAKKLRETWNKSKPEFRDYTLNQKRDWWEALKTKALGKA